MTGMAAIAFCAAFTSCSKEITPMSEEEMVAVGVQKIYSDYEASFQKVFGTPAPGHTWGFSDVAGTRTENANANEWADPNKAYGGLLVPPPLTPEQIAVVKKYFQTHPNLGYEDPKWSNYFIQQVYKGHTGVPEGCATPEAYLAANGSTLIIASDHMDHLIAVDPAKGIYDHINNFNHGDCSTNGTVLDNGGNANDGPFHSDKIMYMMNSTTKSFGYHNSDGSLYHTEYTGLVSYKTIMQAMGAEANCLDDDWNRSFMGFDFEQMVGSSVYKPILDYQHWTDPKDQVQGVKYYNNFPVIGYETFEFEGKTYNFLTSETNMYAADKNETSYVQKNGSYSTTPGKANWSDRPSDAIIRDLLSKGYLPYSDTLKDWVKVGGTADGYFSDWIVTLTEAKTTTPPPPSSADLRVMAEDLSANDEGKDFDFNDVVFDVYFSETVGEAYVMVLAAGGTLPLKVHDTEVHRLFGQPTNMMINTHAEDKGLNGISNQPAQKIQLTGITVSTKSDVNKKVKIMVQKDVLVNGKNQKEWVELVNSNAAACKIGVNPSIDFANERDDVNTIVRFNEWVTEGGQLEPTNPNN